MSFNKGILTRRSNKSRELTAIISLLSKFVPGRKRNIILLFDGLDRLDDDQVLSQLVTSDLQDISSSGIGVVLVAPLITEYSHYRGTIEQAVNSFKYQPCFDIFQDPDAHNFFETVLTTRASEDFLEKDAIESLIMNSGGVLRDLISLTQASIEEAYLSGSDKVQKDHVNRATFTFARAQFLGLSYQQKVILQEVLSSSEFTPTTTEEIKLLATRHIIEYEHPQKRFIVHPVIQTPIREALSLHDPDDF